MSIKVVISDVNAGHAASVKAAVLAGAGGALQDSEVQTSFLGFAQDMALAQSLGASAVVRSTTGAASLAAMAGEYYRSAAIQTFMPAGSNSPGEVFESNGGTNLPAIVLTGAGDTDNETGDDIEFFAPDTVTIEPDLSSYSNPYIAGQLLAVKEQLACSWWEARFRARVTGSRSGVWDEEDGFGLINVAAAIAYAGAIDNDPFQDIGAVGVLSLTQNQNSVNMIAAAVANASSYVFEKNGGAGWVEVQRSSSRQCQQYLVSNVETSFRYKAINEAEATTYSSIASAVWAVPEPEPPVMSNPPVENQRYRASIGPRKFV